MTQIPSHSESGNTDVIRHYLLGLSTEDECDQIEANLFADDEFFGQIKEAEDQLIEEYLTGSLSLSDQKLFEQKYLQVPERRKRVELTSDLLRFAQTRKTLESKSPADDQNHPKQPLQPESTVIPFPTPKITPDRWKPLAIAATLVILVGSGWVWWKIARLQAQIEQTQTTHQQEASRAASLEHQLIKERETTAELAKRLEAESQQRSQLEQTLLNHHPTTSQPVSETPSLLSCILFPNLTRSSGNEKPLRLRRSTRTIHFQLVLRADQPEADLTVRIRTAEDVEVWNQAHLHARQTRGQKQLILNIPSTTFELDDYVIEVYHQGPDQTVEKIATYHVAIRK